MESAPSISAPLASLSSLAIVLPSWVGDAVMATPVLRAARAALPRARIVGVMRPGLDDLLRGTPWLDELTVCNMKGLVGVWRLAGAIKASNPDAVLLLPNSFRSALAARLSCAAVRAGYARDGRRWLLTHPQVVPDRSSPIAMIDYYGRLACSCFGFDSIDPRVELACTDADRRAADELLRDVPDRFVVLNPGANRPDKRWPVENFAATADQLAALHRVSIVINGSPKEREIAHAIGKLSSSAAISLAERGVTLGSLKAILQRASLMITNDTGPRHLGAALGTPLVTLFGPTDHRWTTLNCPRERIILAEPFLPGELVADRHPKACAIEKISVADVVAAADALLNRRL